MKPTCVLFVAAVGVGGFIFGTEVQKQNMYEELLWSSYGNSSNAIKHHSQILENLKTGNENKAISHLDRIIDLEASVVTSCSTDLCKERESSDFDESLKLYKDYRNKYPSKNAQ